MNQRYVPHCCLVFITEKKYLSKNIKYDEELILKNIKIIELFRKKIEQGQLLEKDIFLYERSQNLDEVDTWRCIAIKKDKIINYNFEKIQLIFFGVGEGRVYVEEERFNTEYEGKRNL